VTFWVQSSSVNTRWRGVQTVLQHCTFGARVVGRRPRGEFAKHLAGHGNERRSKDKVIEQPLDQDIGKHCHSLIVPRLVHGRAAGTLADEARLHQRLTDEVDVELVSLEGCQERLNEPGKRGMADLTVAVQQQDAFRFFAAREGWRPYELVLCHENVIPYGLHHCAIRCKMASMSA
jgi:hypothetical protein